MEGNVDAQLKFRGSPEIREVQWAIQSMYSWMSLSMLEDLPTLQGCGIIELFLKYIKHPEQLAELSFDPLADIPNSPWELVRQDELIRAEILQDVQRLPDEPFYHEEVTQRMILDILFIYCKLDPTAGGYRQGMHELLAPLVYVIYQDAIDRAIAGADDSLDQSMVELLDANFIEHDAFALFSKIMERAQPFYKTAGSDASSAADQSAIVEKSRHIHEILLMQVDPELANHLKNIEVLPQIFLIRWIRLLFSREFPFEHLLVLWDSVFAFDPSLDLIDLICVSMLIRIRWTLLEADYSVALQLLLRYPSPQAPHGPHTFVDDAIYLQGHLNTAGGSALILKYTGKPPTSVSAESGPSTPMSPIFAIRQRTLGARSPLSTPARLLQHPGGVEALFQGAAKNVIERGEKLGINQAVRDAMGEIRRNVQGFQDSRYSASRSPRDPFVADDRPASVAVAHMERRNRHLAAMLDDSITSLKILASAKPEGDISQHTEAIEMAAAKIQFVKVYLEDSSLALPGDELPAISTLSISSQKENRSPTVALDTTPVVMTSAVEALRSDVPSHGSRRDGAPSSPTPARHARPDPTTPTPGPKDTPTAVPQATPDVVDHMDTDISENIINTDLTPKVGKVVPTETTLDPSAAASKVARPQGPLPTRSTLAQSSFSWMLEPDTSAAAAHPPSLGSNRASSGGGSSHKKRPSGANSRNRERNAFLFGEVTSDATGAEGESGEGRGRETSVSRDEIFGLQTLKTPKGKGLGASGDT